MSLLLHYHDNDEIKPAPSVCEIFDKAQGQPFHAHLQEEDHSKYTVHVVQDVLQGRSIFQVYILKSLKKKWMKIESNLVESSRI